MITEQTLDLETLRCPTALLRVRQALRTFADTANIGAKLIIQSIEPSLTRDIAYFIEHEIPNIIIADQLSAEITPSDRNMWLSSDEHDEDDFIELNTQFLWIIEKLAD